MRFFMGQAREAEHGMYEPVVRCVGDEGLITFSYSKEKRLYSYRNEAANHAADLADQTNKLLTDWMRSMGLAEE